jgi:hypothetical protein
MAMDGLDVPEVEIASRDRFGQPMPDILPLRGIKLIRIVDAEAVSQDDEVGRIAVGLVGHSAA